MPLQPGDTAISESDGRTMMRLVRDVTDQVEETLPEHQRWWVAERLSGARRLAVVHGGERIVQVRDRQKLSHDVRRIIDAEGASAPAVPGSIEHLARRALGANAIVRETNRADLDDGDNVFEKIHELANDLTIDTQRALARRLGWLVGSDDMAEDIPAYGAEMFDELVHGIASDAQISKAAGIDDPSRLH